MHPRRASAPLAQLWQLPLLLVSIGLFGYAAYLFIDPKPGLTLDERIGAAQAFLKEERPDAANALLNRILTSEKLTADQQGSIHLLLADSIDMAQKQRKIAVAANHISIIEQTRLAVGNGAKLDSPAYRRLGEAYEALHKPAEALESYRQAMNLDPTKSLRLQRKVIDLQLAQDDIGPAELSLDQYLKSLQLTDSERGWALGQKAGILADAGNFAEARELLDQALRLATDPVAQGEVNYHLGYCALKLGNMPEAERYFRAARDLLKTQHPLDADATYWLGKIAQDRGDAPTALSFYEIVLVSHIDSRVAPLALMGRGMCRIVSQKDDAGLTDLHDLVDQLQAKSAMRTRVLDQAIATLQKSAQILAGRQNLQGALELLAYEQTLQPDPPASFYARLASVFEKRGDQHERSVPSLQGADRVRAEQQTRDARTHAGDAYVAYSRKLTVSDDRGYGDALWRGIDLYERAGNTLCVISALDMFASERPEDPLAPEALLRLGRAYQAAGLFDKAIAAFERNQLRYPKSLAASKSAVPLAQALTAKGPESYQRAEKVLLGVVENNPLVTPDAEEFRQALFELAQLYYRTDRYEESVARLEEFTQRYPSDDRMGQLLFLMADSYRKSAGSLDTRLAAAEPAAGPAALDVLAAAAAKRDRLVKAKSLYDKIVERYRNAPPEQAIDKLYVKLSYFYRADCLYDLGDYAEAIKLYGDAAFRYQDDPASLAAYVQIVNSNCALGRFEEAKTANQRARYLLERIPKEAFNNGTFSMPKDYYAQWLKWTTESGMF